MAWVKVDDQFPDHPKVIAAGPLAKALFVDSLCYANRLLTDGFVPDRIAKRLASEYDEYVECAALIEKLTACGLWEKVADGYMIHEYLDYQPSAAKIKEERATNAKRQADWRERKHNDASNAPSNAVTNASNNGHVTGAPSRPVPSRKEPTPDQENAPNGAAPQNGKTDEIPPPKPKKPLPTNGIAQEIVAAFCQCAGIDEPAVYAKSVGQAQLLVKAGVTVEDIPSLFEAANWGGGVDLGRMLNEVDRWRSEKHAPPPPKHVKYPDSLQKRIDVWSAEQIAEGLPILPFPSGIQRDIEHVHASLRELGRR